MSAAAERVEARAADEIAAADAVTRAAIYRERFNKARATQITALLVALEARLSVQLAVRLERLSAADRTRYVRGQYTTERLRRMLESVQAFAREWTRIVEEGISEGGRELIGAELALNERVAGVAGLVGEGVSGAQVFLAAKSRPMQTRLLSEMYREMDRNTRRRVTEAVREGFILGETNAQVIRRVRTDALDISRRGAEGLVRTAMNHLSAQTAVESFRALGVERMIWTSTLDSRTTALCRNLDGREIDLGAAVPRTPPAHFRCRSFLRPKLPGLDGVERASKGSSGPKPVKNETYPEWFARQSAAFQRDVLGATRYKLYKAGVPMSKFTDARATREYTVATLRAQHTTLFRELGL